MSWLETGVKTLSDPTFLTHQGFVYHCSALNASLANDANFDMMITTPSDDYIHMIIEASASATTDLLFYEGVTASGGDAETVYNLKRTSARVWGGAMVTGPTVTGLGTLLASLVMPGGSRNQAVGSSASFDLKWVCKASTKYLVRITNRSGGAIRASIGCNHYSSAQIPDA